jgi:anti-sigma28 factor (negative regulator of flagellin synthesis)
VQDEVEAGGIVDKIEISDNARAKLAELADQALAAEKQDTEITEGNREDRLAQIKQRIDSGFYDQPGVDEIVADRLIDDLDL